MTTVLVIEPRSAAHLSLADLLARVLVDIEITAYEHLEDLEAVLQTSAGDLVVTEYRLDRGDGLDVIRRVHHHWPQLPIVMVTRYGCEQVAAAAIKAGASDYLTGEELERLPTTVRQLLDMARERAERAPDAEGRRSIEEALYRANAELEQRVLERTAALAEANMLLQYELAERRMVEAALRTSERRFRIISELTSDFVYEAEVDRDDRHWIVWANDAMSRVTGYTLDEIVGRGDTRWLIHPDDLPIYDQFIGTLLSGRQETCELRIVIKGGAARRVLVSNHPIHNLDDGRTIGFIGAAQDITERKQNEEQLRFQARLLDTVGQAVVATDPDGRIVYWNRAASELYDWAATDMYGHNLKAMVAEGSTSGQTGDMLRQLQAGIPWQGELLVRRVDGTAFPVLFTDTPLQDDQGQLIGIISSATDITNRRRAEEERLTLERKMLEAQKLESLGVLAGGIAHDFNNMLSVIIGHTGMLKMDLPADSPLRDSAERIDLTAQRAADLTRQMLAYAGKGHSLVQPLDLNALVREMASLLHTSVPKTVTLRTYLSSTVPVFDADPTQLRQLVMNLVINASEAIGQASGTITLTTDVCRIDAPFLDEALLAGEHGPGEYIMLKVADTGGGMDAATAARIFDPFFTTKSTGRGMGLAVAHGVVRRHRGVMHVASTPGHGTTFTVLFPFAEAEQFEAAEPQRSQPDWRGSGTVLVVDDEPDIRTILARTLAQAGFDVHVAADGREALAIFRAQADRIVCVVLDLAMPQIDGFEAFFELRRIKPGVPIVVISGYNANDIKRRFAENPPSEILQKPFALAELHRAVRDAVGHRP